MTIELTKFSTRLSGYKDERIENFALVFEDKEIRCVQVDVLGSMRPLQLLKLQVGFLQRRLPS